MRFRFQTHSFAMFTPVVYTTPAFSTLKRSENASVDEDCFHFKTH